MKPRKSDIPQSPLFTDGDIGQEIVPLPEALPAVFAGRTELAEIQKAKETFLLTGIGGLAVRNKEPSDEMAARDKFREKFSWIPYRKQEVTIANRGLESHLDHLVNSVTVNGLAAVRSAYDSANDYYVQSMKTLDILKEVADYHDDGSEIVYSDKIRTDDDALYVLSRYVSNVESLNAFNWPARKRSRTNSGHLLPNSVADDGMQKIKMRIGQLGDDELTKLWHLAHESNLERSNFWGQQLDSVKDHDRIRELRHEDLSNRRSA